MATAARSSPTSGQPTVTGTRSRQPGDRRRRRYRGDRRRERLRRQQQRRGHRHIGRRLFRDRQSFTGDLRLRRCRRNRAEHPAIHRNGFGGDASGTINVASLAAAPPFTFSGDTFQDEQTIGGRALSNVGGRVVANYGGFGGSTGGVIHQQ